MITHLKTEVKGGALYFAIVIILLLSLIASGFILLNRLWFQEDTLFLKNTELNDNLDSAGEWFKIQPKLASPGDTSNIDLYGDSTFVRVEAKRWGLLRMVKTTAKWKNLVMQRKAFYSELKDKSEALYLTDNNKFLSLVGKCLITGDCHLPALGIRAGEMDGGTFTGKRMIDGKIFQSEKTLTPLNRDLISGWESYLDGKFRKTDSIVRLKEGKDLTSAVSFDSSTEVINGGKNTILQDIALSGNIIVSAVDTVFIEPTAELQDVLVFANTIIVDDKVRGSFQLFARKSISIGKHCTLGYPSYAVCLSKSTPGTISIGDSSRINGGVLIYSTNEIKGSNRLEMSEGNQLTGTIYVDGEVCFKGRIDGSLCCNKFYLETPRAFYENFLKDAVINSQSVPARFGSYVVDGSPDKLKLVKPCL